MTFEFLWYSFNIPVFHVFIYGLVLGAVVMWLLLSTARTQRQQKKQIHNLQGAISSLQGDSKSSKH
ncbi:MAG: DUF1049 domain-containing protein [Leptospiraceae bacterium]|nr:DUF1049 domain-containing protein [Leptospiraceae bacterium]